MKPHDWTPSPFTYGEAMCRRCCLMSSTAALLGQLNECEAAVPEPAPPIPTPTQEG